MRNKYYLRIGTDTLDDANGYATKAGAIKAYRQVAETLDQYGQTIEASIHIAATRANIAEYPDFVLSLGPRGGVKVEKV